MARADSNIFSSNIFLLNQERKVRFLGFKASMVSNSLFFFVPLHLHKFWSNWLIFLGGGVGLQITATDEKQLVIAASRVFFLRDTETFNLSKLSVDSRPAR